MNPPVAWAAINDDGDIAWIGYTQDAAADAACGRRIVPLYLHQQPTLTDAEREGIEAMSENWTETKIFVTVPVTIEYDPGRVSFDYLVAEAERGLTHSLQHIAGHYRIEGGEASVRVPKPVE